MMPMITPKLGYLGQPLDLLLIPFLIVLVIHAMMGRFSKRNFVFLPILVLLFAGNLLFHLEHLELIENGFYLSQRIGLGTVVLLITIIGGRVVPAFTTNALRSQGVTDLPSNRIHLTVPAIASVFVLLIVDVARPETALVGWVAVAAAVINGARFMQWKWRYTLGEPLLWVLHLGYAWLVFGLFLKGAGLLWLDISPQTAVHALTAGAIGTMTLAVMSRAALGHTGRPLRAPRSTVAAYALVTLGAMGRILAPLLAPELYGQGILMSGVCWAAAYLLFAVAFWPVLTGPRVSKQA